MKRIFDFSVAFSALVILSPLLITLSLLVKLNDRGPILFKQRRVGQHGKSFLLYKFRSMRVSGSENNGIFELGYLSRVTSVGKFMRRNKLDELPQLYNVLRGEMSLVGPRPEVETWVAVYPDKWERILTVRPGMTDNASVEFHNEEKLLSESPDPESIYRNEILPKKLDLCIQYAYNHSFKGDIRILILTIKTILFK
jgi:lipopolysaccharide/colanic/teichoic acid biosynthesis glycosyltransferase